MIDLTAAGLTSTEAKCYTALLERQEWKPADLAQNVKETRTNVYKVLDKLVEFGLAERFDKAKKLHYRATNPARLIELAQEQRKQREQAERQLELNTQDLTAQYIKINEQPGVRYFQGEKEIGKIFQEIAESKEEVLSVHSLAGIDFYGFKTMHNLRMLAPNAGVKRRSLTQDSELATKDWRISDPAVLLTRTWLKKDDYNAPVEWVTFEDKLCLISYGSEALGIVIESQQIATAFKQLFNLIERGQKLLPDYKYLPREAKQLGVGSHKL